MKNNLIISPNDNVAVALSNINKGEVFTINAAEVQVVEDIPVKHKFTLQALNTGDVVTMYGVPVGKTLKPIKKGALITTENLKHISAPYKFQGKAYNYQPPYINGLSKKTFLGYHRKDGQVGTANYWVFVPMVFCQNRNLKVLKEAFESELGFKKENPYRLKLRGLVNGIKDADYEVEKLSQRKFKNIDGIKFLTHEGGCGGTKDDAQALVNLLAGYIKNPNVAGATVMSLGCQHAQIDMLQEALNERFKADKPVLYFEQQKYATENEMLTEVINATYKELEKANQISRKPAPLSKLSIGLECGGSDGFSGITANPLIGVVSDKINALGGKSILSEFPELCGVEQDILDRCPNAEVGNKFIDIMERYSNQAEKVGSGFDMNPSPGNVKDGLITDAIKSAGAATKGGRAPVADVIDYGEYATKQGLNLLCTPGNDVESTTGLAGFGANIILFSTGLGTPTGNVVCPVIKISSNSMLPAKMKDIIDFDAGRLISEDTTQEELSEELIDLIIEVASGRHQTCATKLGQDDFIPWKRGVSL
ncbi:altronate dehydratase family protein [Sabulilitoribacter arenilitoris]|uniref:Altronate dehydratase family protein n=1 Tax=Wocania arenilitoris TaxID=2044858 RepID=A0AAE3EPP4_9FLAO|nr:altronate dehydratase family protein [Wocania arenilitoris]MCF7567854.1 altronate dehydratase family protein [Wocania arenilitoris]